MERLQLQRQLESDLPALLLGWPASDSDAARDWLQRWRDKEDPLFHPRAAIDGGSLQRELQLQASPQLGALLERLMLERAFGRLHNRDDAVTLARQWLESANNDGAKAPRHD
jgi:tRNA nucleotidyltransferase (CCA-adding enzyme)